MIKKIYTPILVAAVVLSAVADNSFFDGRRFDYLNEKGERLESLFPDSYNPGVSVMMAHGSEENGYTTASCSGNPFAAMRVVPWGQESYDLNISSDLTKVPAESAANHDLQPVTIGGLEYWEPDRVQQKGVPVRASAAGAGQATYNVKCGQGVKFYVDVPQGTHPILFYERFYLAPGSMWTFTTNWIDWANDWKRGLPTNFWSYYPNDRDWYFTDYERNGWFERDENIPNRWWYKNQMANEPINLIVAAVKPGYKELQQAVAGVYNDTYCGYEDSALIQGMYGEVNVNMCLGEAMGADAYLPLFDAYPEWKMLWRMDFSAPNYKWSSWGWNYARTIIEHSTFWLERLDLFKGYCTDAQIENARASLLTMRCHAYLRLLQYYAPRWEDSEGGTAKCAPLRLTSTVEGIPLASMNEIFDRCYADLNEAIGYFEKNKFTKSTLAEPDAALAHGTFARLALIKHDWTTARSHAAAARAGKPLTTNDEFLSGFHTPAPSWIWGNGYAYGYAGHTTAQACNGYRAEFLGGYRINLDLYNKLASTDIRRKTFLTWDLVRKYKKDDWFSTAYISPVTLKVQDWPMTVGISSVLNRMRGSRPGPWDMPFGQEAPYTHYFLGMQLKFWLSGLTMDDDAADKAVFMRTEEMLLAEAEAAYMLGDKAAAKALIEELNKIRVGADYVCPSADAELLEEIRLTRRIELWGEGHSWTDFKRWNIPMERRAWVEGDSNSGNFTENNTVSTSQCNGWRLPIPLGALRYNDKINPDEMHYTGISYETEPAQQQAPALKQTAPLRPMRPQTQMFKPNTQLLEFSPSVYCK